MISAAWETIKRNIFASAAGLAVLVLLFEGFIRGFNGSHISGILGLFTLHHKAEIAALFKKADPKIDVEALFEDYAVFKANMKQDLENVRNDVSKASMAIAFKTGIKTEPKP